MNQSTASSQISLDRFLEETEKGRQSIQEMHQATLRDRASMDEKIQMLSQQTLEYSKDAQNSTWFGNPIYQRRDTGAKLFLSGS